MLSLRSSYSAGALSWQLGVHAKVTSWKAPEAEGVEAASHSIDFQLVKDATWHRRNLWRMTGSRSGYWVLPSFLGMTCVFLGISMLQAANYACSQGQLSSMELASSLHTLDFKPWQRKYQVHIDTSFKQVVTWHAEPPFLPFLSDFFAVGFEFQTSSDLSPSSPIARSILSLLITYIIINIIIHLNHCYIYRYDTYGIWMEYDKES